MVTALEIVAATAGGNTGAIVVILLVFLAGYVLACLLWPFAACRWCERGKKRSPGGRAWRVCGHCGGTGARVRLGRRLWSAGIRGRDRNRDF